MPHEWKERPGFVQEKLSTGHSCNPRAKPLLSWFRFRVDGYAVACTENDFSKLVDRLMLQKVLGPPVTANRDVFSWKLEKRRARETCEERSEPALNIERGLNSKISLRAVHWARSLQAPAFERERWVLRDQNIYLRTCGKRERENVSGKERESDGKNEEERRWKKAKESGGEKPFLLDPEIHRENNVSGLTRRPWPLTCSFR